MDHHSACLLLLTCLAGMSASDTEQGRAIPAPYGPTSVEISGVDVVTVGIPYGFWCSAECYPRCWYQWTRDGVTTVAQELNLLLRQVEPKQVITCKAVNPLTGATVTVQKTLQVTVGPSNVQITGPGFLTVGTPSVFNCSAHCYPACSFTWIVKWENVVQRHAEGNTISILPPPTANSETLICHATDTLSHLFVATNLLLHVATLFDIYITGPDTVIMGQEATFLCFVTCTPKCDWTWRFRNQTYYGDKVQLPILHQGNQMQYVSRLVISTDDYSSTVPLVCQVKNVASQAVISVTKELTLIDPISVRPASEAPPVSGEPFSLQCLGAQDRASVAWQKNGRSVPTSERVHISSDGIALTFKPLLQADEGLYQCVVTEGVGPIKSLGFDLRVNYGPGVVTITGPESLEVGVTASFRCSAECAPPCRFTWSLYGKPMAGSELEITLSRYVSAESISCEAENTVSGKIVTVNETLQVSDPLWCGC